MGLSTPEPAVPPSLDPCRIPISTVSAALAGGWRNFRRVPAPAAGFAAVFALIGVVIFALLEHFGLAPMRLPLAGGFLLVGPAVLAGFFALRRATEAGRRPAVGDVLAGFRQAPRGLWGLAGVCCLLFLIWVSDAATVYSFMIGGAVPDAMLATIKLLGTLWDQTGAVAVPGLAVREGAVPAYDEQRLREETDLPATSSPIGTGPILDRIWNRPSITVTGM